ncbi:PP2C family protein-serine/threonine phosphatase [Pseudomonas sp. F1_0610]|uniref:PP2C family protein-serine/threonine phosphatase n=1 Tax=Pseudomonas sp. F1_0610 TaxID=3114284 RepID=UPI0039C175C4
MPESSSTLLKRSQPVGKQRNNLQLLQEDQQAGQIMQSMIRPQSPWVANDFVFTSFAAPSLYLSGDAVDYFYLQDGRIAFYLGDVSGHGTAAALVGILLQSMVRQTFLNEPDISAVTPSYVLQRLNTALLSYNLTKHVTMVFGIIDPLVNELTWSIAGHLPLPVLYVDGKAQYLEGKGQPVGLFAEASFNNATMSLPQQFSLTVFSDGVFEVLPKADLSVHEIVLPQCVQDAGGKHESLVKILGLDNLVDMPDDIAMLVLSRNLA